MHLNIHLNVENTQKQDNAFKDQTLYHQGGILIFLTYISRRPLSLSLVTILPPLGVIFTGFRAINLTVATEPGEVVIFLLCIAALRSAVCSLSAHFVWPVCAVPHGHLSIHVILVLLRFMKLIISYFLPVPGRKNTAVKTTVTLVAAQWWVRQRGALGFREHYTVCNDIANIAQSSKRKNPVYQVTGHDGPLVQNNLFYFIC